MPEISLDQSVLGEGLGAAKPVEVPATHYRQGGRDMYHITVAIAQLPQIVVKRPDPDYVIEGNRKVDASRAKKFGTYLLENSDWVSPAIIVRAPANELRFSSAQLFGDGTAWGVLTIPLDILTEVLLLDGQHRTLGAFIAIDTINAQIMAKRDAIERARRNGNEDIIPELTKQLDKLRGTRDRFTREHVSVDIALVATDDAKQMFADINNNAKGVNPDYTTILDQRHVMNRLAAELIEDHPLLKGRVELGQSTRMSSSNPHLMGAKTVADIVRTVLVGISGRVGARVDDELSRNQPEAAKRVSTFLDILVAGFDDLQAVSDGDLEPVELRDEKSPNRSMIGSATMLRVLAGFYHEVTRADDDSPPPMSRAEVETFFRDLAPKLRDIPIADNDDFWLSTGAFIPNTGAPQARQGTMSKLVKSLVEWAESGELATEPDTSTVGDGSRQRDDVAADADASVPRAVLGEAGSKGTASSWMDVPRPSEANRPKKHVTEKHRAKRPIRRIA
jgi:hypothetical protein